MTIVENDEYYSDDDHDTDDSEETTTIGYALTEKTGSSSTHNTSPFESTAVTSAKLLIFVFIVTVALVGALRTTYCVRKQENDRISYHLKGFAKEVTELSQSNVERVIHAARSLSRSITYAANRQHTTGFPFITVPNFEVLAAEARELANARIIMYTPRVASKDLISWEDFARNNTGWVKEALQLDDRQGLNVIEIPKVHTLGKIIRDSQIDFYSPIWQTSPALNDVSVLNLDLIAFYEQFGADAQEAIQKRMPVLSGMYSLKEILRYFGTPQADDQQLSEEVTNLAVMGPEKLNPISLFHYQPDVYVLHPVFQDESSYNRLNDGKSDSNVAGFVVFVSSWELLLADMSSNSISGLHVVVDDGCGQQATYNINGSKASFIGRGDKHDVRFSLHELTGRTFRNDNDQYDGTHALNDKEDSRCKYTIRVYPSIEIVDVYRSLKHEIYSAAIGIIFATIIILLLAYDYMVVRHQRKLIDTATRTNALITTLFPKEIQRRILQEASSKEAMKTKVLNKVLGNDEKAELHEVLAAREEVKSIADFFPNATIFFADISGFTAWSSTRDPCQVFQLLETIYQEFDLIAKRRRVFKVETIADSYMAATGLPEERKDHAVAMARFARHCMVKFESLVKELELSLGPDTGDLALRIGINSGPVTAGVLRGERARFQLFGDTVNTASRMETTGLPGRIHVSRETADLLTAAGKQRWLTARADKIQAKGKGELQTFWLELSAQISSSEGVSVSSKASCAKSTVVDEDEVRPQNQTFVEGSSMGKIVASTFSDKTQRLIRWNSDILKKSLKLVIAQRRIAAVTSDDMEDMRDFESRHQATFRSTNLVLDEVVEVMNLPLISQERVLLSTPTYPDSIQLSAEVEAQILDFVRTIAAMYHDANPFHNFEHASHVVMSTSKLLARIVGSSKESSTQKQVDETNTCNQSYGITSDPLMQFAALFSALIHDTDHPGVPNATLVRESSSLAVSYRGKSVAEQNSVDLAWDLFMDPEYEQLRRALYVNKAELVRFRQLVVNMVMATDICDKELGALRKKRWEKVFATDDFDFSSGNQYAINRKATIVLEHLIQASDVCHTMQHWNIYLKWNERFFQECWRAYQHGRLESDPSENWYKGEIDFFDYYVIPLARKLESCGVFGVSSDEYLAYAVKNRDEWSIRGEALVKKYLERSCSS